MDISSAIVVHDPNGIHGDGQVIEGVPAVAQARRAGVVLLPYERGIEDEPVSAYFRRGFGFPGHPFSKGMGERGCPMLLHVQQGRPWIYWCAVFAPNGPNPSGTFRLAGSQARQSSFSGALSAVESRAVQVAELRLAEHPGGVAVCGSTRVNVVGDGYMALCLWAVARDVAVSLVAVTQCGGEYRYP